MQIISDQLKYSLNIEELLPGFEHDNMSLGIERVSKAIKEIGSPCQSIPAIQIVGTNGKGSIASFLRSCFEASDITTGIFTSPHLVDWCERISINETLIKIQDLCKIILSIQTLIKKNKLSPFESLFISALIYFEEKGVELLILEAGLGGRLDATTSHKNRPIIAMASIGIDHCEFLGNNLTQIAKEKSAVIQRGSIVITGEQSNEVEKVLKSVSKEKKAKIVWVSSLISGWELNLTGKMQRQNAAVAKAVLEELSDFGWKLTEKTIRKGFSKATWPGRLQYAYWKQLPIILDGAHNPHSAKNLSIERDFWENQEHGVEWILGIQTKKNAPEILQQLLRKHDRAWIVPLPKGSSWSKKQLSEIYPERKNQLFHAKDAEEALKQINAANNWPNPPPVIAGSLYLIGDLLSKKIVTPE